MPHLQDVGEGYMSRYINAELIEYDHVYMGRDDNGAPCYEDAVGRNTIEAIPTADVREVMASAWVPISVRLPKVDAKCIVSLDTFIDFATFTGENFHAEWCDYYLTEVTAWMPQPKLYRGDE